MQRLSFLERAQQLPEAQNNPEHRLTAEKSWLYAMQLKSIVGQIKAVCPEFMAEDNDAGKNMIRMVGTLSRMPTGMIRKIDQGWFLQVMEWLGANYHALCQDLELKKIVESIYNIHTNYLADLDELETRLGLKLGLLTREILQKLGELKPKWVALSGDRYGTTEQSLRDQAEYWKTYLQHQAHFRAQQRIARLVEQEDSLEKKKVIMKDLLKPDFLKEISHLHTLSVAEINALKDKLTAIAKEMPGLSSLGKYIEKKLQEIEAEIAGLFRAYRFGRILFPMRSGLWTQVEARLPSLNSYSDEEKIIRASITATEKELEASLAREDEHLEIVWDTYRASVDKLNPEIITKKLEKDRELCAQIKTLVEKLNNCSLEDLRAQQASKEDRELLDLLEVEREKNLLELEGFLTSSRQKKEEEKEKATQRLKENIQENCGSVKKGGQGLAQSATLRSRFSQMKVQGNRLIASSGPDTERPKQNEPKEENSIEQLQKLIDSVVVPLAKHISDKQFYHLGIADAQWILQLKQVHDLLVKAKMALSEYEKNLTAQAQSQAASVMAYFSAATPYLRLADSLLKLFSQVGDILEGINKLQPRMQQNWFKPLKELLSSAQKLLLNVTDEREPTQEREPLDPAPVSVSQTIKQDIKEFLVELPSNLPGRAELDRDLTALLSMISRVLDSNALTLSGNGLALYNSIEFKRLMDLISKISAVAGSDFVYEKLSNHRALFTKQLSAAIQHVLSEEITMGYRAGVMTAGLYKMAEVLAGRGLIDIPRLYAAQLSYLYAQNSDVVIKDHFAAYIENLLKAFVDKQEEEWVKTLGMLIDEKTGIEIKVSRITSGRSLLPGKDALAEQQGLELRKAQITRLIVAKNREIKFLKRYAAAQHNERTGLSDMYAEQEKVLATLNGIVRHITKVKWDIYNHDPATFDSNINKINQLIVLLEHHIELLAAEDRNPTKLNESVEAIKVDIKKGQKLPPAMQRLFTLALDTFATDQILTTQFSLLAFNEPRSVESEGRSSVSTDEIAG
ncbi:MAG: hypothetical protein NTU49_06450, partial [Gammaproteobacteria bacterium]|nr:hypothetical protein [Gammaproteobacteria bacterium]